MRKPRDTGSRDGARARAGRLGVGVGGGANLGRAFVTGGGGLALGGPLRRLPVQGGASATLSLPLSVVLVPPSCKEGERVCVA